MLPFKHGEFTSAYQGLVSRVPPIVDRFRRVAVVNTYCETAPDVDFEKLLNTFQVGVDRLLVRTVYE